MTEQTKFDVYIDTEDGACKLLQAGVIAASKPAALGLVTQDPNAFAVPEGTDPATVPAIAPVEGDSYDVFVHPRNAGVSEDECKVPVVRLVAADRKDAIRRGVEAGVLKSTIAYNAVRVQGEDETPPATGAPPGSTAAERDDPTLFSPPPVTQETISRKPGGGPRIAADLADVVAAASGFTIEPISIAGLATEMAKEHVALLLGQLRGEVSPDRVIQQHVALLASFLAERTQEELGELFADATGVPVPKAHQPVVPQTVMDPDGNQSG